MTEHDRIEVLRRVEPLASLSNSSLRSLLPFLDEIQVAPGAMVAIGNDFDQLGGSKQIREMVRHFVVPSICVSPCEECVVEQLELTWRIGFPSIGRVIVIEHHIYRVKVQRIGAMPLQQRCSQVALQRCKPESIVSISLQKKLVEAIAKPTNTVVKDNRVRQYGCSV